LVQHASLILQIRDWLETPMLKYKMGLRLSFKLQVGLETLILKYRTGSGPAGLESPILTTRRS